MERGVMRGKREGQIRREGGTQRGGIYLASSPATLSAFQCSHRKVGNGLDDTNIRMGMGLGTRLSIYLLIHATIDDTNIRYTTLTSMHYF